MLGHAGMDLHIVLPFAAAVCLALIHLFAGRLHGMRAIPRSWWLSAAGGVSVAYVFVHLIPELAEAQEVFRAAGRPVLGFAEHHVYLVALAGLAVFYGLENLALASRHRQRERGEDRTSAGVFWLHITSFALYNLLIGYLLMHREEHTLGALAMYFVAMATHFVVNDLGLREHHKERYVHLGRWLVAGAVLVGAGVGAATEIHPMAIAVLLALLAGGVVLNVMKEELPGERRSRFSAFAGGAAAYAAVLLAIA